ncbi:hypothetical protein PILCRDRAFT_787464 [Piloderma croceum F 1598]|uniref:Cytochrome P450 n=1 Tax=Piloderma croceum (strain F 1598) TaxID=765440 RepID=A0A0C3BWB6_PILCF|nr:hypothetical protein PILCRDRAFT_787464 [Piloderma croceum F 1598]
MSNSTLLTAFALGAFPLIFLVRHLSTKYKTKQLPLPPGPKTSWFGGIQLPTSHPWLTYARWKDTFGDIIYIYKYGNPIVVLNTAEAANLLLDKRSNKYSSRPRRTMLNEL